MPAAYPRPMSETRRVRNDRRGVERRKAIIEAATNVFARRGFRTASLNEVAEQAGVTPAGILYHFGSKDALLLAVIAVRDRRRADILAEPAKGGLAAISSALRYAEVYESEPHLTALHAVLEVESLDPDSPAYEYFRGRNRFLLDSTEEALRVSQRAGEIRADIDCARVARQVVAFLHGASVLWLKNPELSLVELYHDYFDSLIETLAAHPPTRPPDQKRRSPQPKEDKEDSALLSAVLDELYETEVIDSADVARVSGRDARSVSRWQAGQVEPRRESEERLLELKAVVDLVRRVMRDDAAHLWLRAPNPDLAYQKPLDLIAAGEYQRVVEMLLAIAEGVTT